MSDPAPRHPMRRGMAVRAPPPGHRVPTYPRPPRPGRRVSTVCVPWLSPPSPCRPARAGCARRACPTSLPIPAPTPTRTPTETPHSPALHISELLRPPAQRGGHRGARSCPPRRHCGESRNPAPGPLPAAARTPLPCQGRGRGLGPNHYYPNTPPTKCILPSKYRPIRGLAPPRPRASSTSTPPAPHRGHPPSPCTTGRPQGGQALSTPSPLLPLSPWWRGGRGVQARTRLTALRSAGSLAPP